MVQLRYRRKAVSGYHRIDGSLVYTDSTMEAKIMNRLIKHGFTNGKLRRYRYGISTSLFNYTPDVHLSIHHNDMSRRALVEFKPFSTTEFPKKARLRMLASAKFFRDSVCMLYIEKTHQWYIIEVSGKLLRTEEPSPGFIPVSELPRPRFFIPHYNSRTGRMYWERPGVFLLRKTGDGIGFMIQEIFGPKKRSRRRKNSSPGTRAR